MFQRTAWAQPTHTTNNMHTWGGVQLRRVTWDSYARIPTFITQEISNDMFTLQEPVLPIASKRQVTQYPRVTKKEKQTWPIASIINQTNEVLLRAKRIHIYGIHLGFCLKFL